MVKHTPVQLVLAFPLTPSPDVDGVEAPEQFFDFSKFPALQEVGFEVGWASGSLLWIPTSLSTLRPATSPRMTTILLDFLSQSSAARSIEILLKSAGSDLQQVADEFARIEREFEGAVDLTVFWNAGFWAAFDALDLKVRFCDVDGVPWTY